MLLVNENGRFIDKTASQFNIGLYNLIGGDCGDVDGDGDNDLILANFVTSNANFFADTNKNVLLLNDGRGTFTNAPSSRLPDIPDISRDADFVDIDGDGDLDVFVSNSIGQTGRARSNTILLNNGTGSFTDASDRLPAADATLGTGNGSSHNAHIVDINKDACPDIYVANQIGGNFVPSGIDQFFINQKSGAVCTGRFVDEAFSRGILAGRNTGRNSSQDRVNTGQENLLGRGDSAHEGNFADIDGDGDLDLIIARRANEANLIYMNNGTGHFSNQSYRILPDPMLSTTTLDVGDLTGDGCVDIIFGNGDLNTFEAYQDQMYVNVKDSLGTCTGLFQPMGERHGIPQYINTTKDVLFFDIDRDNDLDVWFGNFGEVDLLLINTTNTP